MTTCNGANGGAPIPCFDWCDGSHGPAGPGTVHEAFAAQLSTGDVITVSATVRPDGGLSEPEIHLCPRGGSKHVFLAFEPVRDLGLFGEQSSDPATRAFGRFLTAAAALAEQISSANSR